MRGINNAAAVKNTVLAAAAAAGSAVFGALGGLVELLGLLGALVAGGYVTGVLVAALWHRSGKSATGALDSRAGFRGLCKKGTVLLVVYIGVLLDRALGIDYVRGALVLFFCGNEGLSLLETIGLMGVPYPPALRKILEALKTEGKMTTDDQGGTH